ncbi:hypothetical protein J6590_000331 [Homalodisca vitripennis]|nr:hypothetical protein J6590_000331 [Homalodisca vitripennis]
MQRVRFERLSHRLFSISSDGLGPQISGIKSVTAPDLRRCTERKSHQSRSAQLLRVCSLVCVVSTAPTYPSVRIWLLDISVVFKLQNYPETTDRPVDEAAAVYVARLLLSPGIHVTQHLQIYSVQKLYVRVTAVVTLCIVTRRRRQLSSPHTDHANRAFHTPIVCTTPTEEPTYCIVTKTLTEESTHTTLSEESTHCIVTKTLSEESTHCIVTKTLTEESTHYIVTKTLTEESTHCIVTKTTLTEESIHCIVTKTLTEESTHCIVTKTLTEESTHCIVTQTLTEESTHCIVTKTLTEEYTHCIVTKTLTEESTHCIVTKTLTEESTHCIVTKTLTEESTHCIVTKTLTEVHTLYRHQDAN